MASTTAEPAWLRLGPARLFPHQPTPFTWSILGPSVERALRRHYSRLGHELKAGATLLQLQGGEVKANAVLFAEADGAVFGRSTPSSWGGLLGRDQGRRAAASLHHATVAAAEDLARVERWWRTVRETQWRQATLLQVMEEIEPRAEVTLLAWQQAWAGVEIGRRQMMDRVEAWIPDCDAPLVDGLLTGLDDSPGDTEYCHQRHKVAEALLRVEQAVEDDLSEGPERTLLEGFLATYGVWAPRPLEAASTRWAEGISTRGVAWLRQEIAAVSGPPSPTLAKAASRRARAAAAAAKGMGPLQRRQFMAIVQEVASLQNALEFAYGVMVRVIDAARTWALAAAGEAVADGRLAQVGDVFLLELEELKQMMTGEWSSAEQVRPIVDARRPQLAVESTARDQ